MTTHTVHTSFNSGMAFTADINGHKVVMDTTAEDGGINSGSSPKRLMLASLAGCTGIDIVSLLNKMKAEFSHLSIEIIATLTDEHPKTYNKVKIRYSIKMGEADHPKMEKAVKLSQEKYCGVSAMFRSFAELTSEIIYI